MNIQLTNNFHGTKVTLRLSENQRRGHYLGREFWKISQNQVKRARMELCGISDCICGGVLGERGDQDIKIVQGLDIKGKPFIYLEKKDERDQRDVYSPRSSLGILRGQSGG